MTKIGMVRCEKNQERCPLTGCITSLEKGQQGFAGIDGPQLVGIFTCRCPGDGVEEKVKILKAKGADEVHFCTCTFSHKEDGGWVMGKGFCDRIDELCRRASAGAGIPCVKGTAHLPEGYLPERFE